MKAATEIHYVRFHAIFDDEAGVYLEDAEGRPVYNWPYVDQNYDGIAENRVRPFVELSFMPKALAASLTPARFLVLSFAVASGKMHGGRIWSIISRNIWWIPTAQRKWRSGISKFGTSPISISGPANRIGELFRAVR